MFSRYHLFGSVFRGYAFINKSTGETLPKHEVFSTYFRSEYATDGVSLEYVSEEKQAKFDQIVLRINGKITPAGRHPLYDIRNQKGWHDGCIINKDTFFMKDSLSREEIRMKNTEGEV